MIAINARFLTQETRGVQRFAEQVCLELGAMRKDLNFVAPHDIRMHASAERLQVRRIGRNRGHLWEQLDLPLWLAKHGYPPLVSLCNTAPLIYRNQIATHHDITYVRHPESYSRTFRGLYKGLTPLLLKRIKALITVSDFSRKEIARYYGYPSEKICVVPNAVAATFRPLAAEHSRDGKRPYLLAVSSPNAHKNFARMVAAFLSLEGFDDVELRIVGDSHSVFAGTDYSVAGNTRVRMLGRLDDEQLVSQYQGATAFIFPSLYEGFGIPPLEAQACGCPVIAARAASIPEVLGDSVLYFEPLNIEDIARCMRHVLQDAGLRDDLRTLGLANVERYSWKRSAQKVSQLIDQALMGKSSPPSFIAWSPDRH
ncbi:glycosyltransferase family 1 protein [Stutzerimonas decontaminans]|jgi:glycosyltransferase involved in cell wall biosynthesis|uniref:Glycosyltransferase family 1 protein n=2 Tax=Stutzerimonas TaxID=2901164 RepID=A0ABX4VUN6_9GAMM|nr:glycosyltransferase family 1 protein [Stutzerimonas decontaminans]AHY43390.1 glycosyl transferase family 1 [Stutzerimonas decontaminans]MCQ4247004.1 glycosyltransferase family 4 protein [Stutzerimonas decontaminans]PNF82880.1 glycosyltransferase family 1 protein [Stutzerimonas decontaminans]